MGSPSAGPRIILTTSAPDPVETPVTTTAVRRRTAPLAPWPHFEEDEIEAVVRVMRSGKVNYWTGQESRRFEEDFAAYVGTKHAIALTNGTVALELALHGLGIGAGDEVILTPRTFIASASAAVMRGATPVFADVDRDSQNVTAETIAAVLTPRTKAIIAVHLAGWPCDMDPIMDLARRHGIAVIEDCAQAHGATYKGRNVGALGDVAAFSFCQDKILTTLGEGGMVTTDDPDLWAKMWAFKDHGKSFDTVYHQPHPPGFRWLHESFGTNWRITEVQAAQGRRILAKLDGWVATRRAHAAVLLDAFEQLPALRTPVPTPDVRHAYYKFYTFVRPDRLCAGWDRDRIMNEEHERRFAERLPIARELGETALMFLVHPTLTEADVREVAAIATDVIESATA